ncbi:MAG: transcription-repair coupling factor [Clostridia bacterium]|nr:transcription-repair coupling factor [Clostridia bacterium]
MKLITRAITADREFSEARDTLFSQLSSQKPLPISVNGLSDGARDAFLLELLAALAERQKAPRLLLARDEGEARSLAALLRAEGHDALFFPAREPVLLNITASHEVERERLSVLCRLLAGESVTVVATPYAALLCTLPPPLLSRNALTLSVGSVADPVLLAEQLVGMGFAAVDLVDGAGQLARRGGILDVFSPDGEYPVRLEFFGDEIDRMEYFDPITQRSVALCEELRIFPARECLYGIEERKRMTEAHRALLGKVSAEEKSALQNEIAVLEGDGDVPFADRYMALLYPESPTLLDYFPAARTVVLSLCESGTEEKTNALLGALFEAGMDLAERGRLAARYAVYARKYGDLTEFLSRGIAVYVSGFGSPYHGALSGLFGFRSRRTVSYFGKGDLLAEDTATLVKGLYRTVVLTESAAEAQAVCESLAAKGLAARVADGDESLDPLAPYDPTVLVTHGSFSSGFELIVPRIAVLSTLPDGTVRRPVRRARVRRHPAGQKLLSYADLSVGDYVVHAVHGIGIFEGMQQIRTDGVTKDYITIRYAGADSLFLPAERLEMISKYIGAGAEDGNVRLSKLGGGEWQRVKSRAKASAKEMAKKLVELYALRKQKEGFAYPPACELEREFADNFEFEETEPQLQAIEEIEGDMMRPVPMDRLLCGDVGFGKTEVALRAAFKAIVSGKQVAVLVPTTILAMQHYQTAVSRMRGYPVNVEMLCGLKKPKEQAKILRRLARGEIDLIIGTHSLLSKNVAFRDLGLLVVDEEQRFGVGQKERLKELAADVDVLTLSATPIPRTLNMALSGIRDMSVLDEAPADRHPVQTYVLEHDDAVILEAVRRELARGGQVLYLYNRVESMEKPYDTLCRAFPDAHIAAAHGKLPKEELEEIWQALVRGEIDVLICTTIVETGVDLPNANTLVIEDADRMGLSQLHQIRGRVGRSGRQAYAYFTYRRGKSLTEIAEKRLRAIREYASFGAGFKIALRDLEIRGAGNLLGAEQHGHIDAVGYDLYVKILNEAILEERGTPVLPEFEARVELAVDAHIPENYITTSPERMEMYKKISLIRCAMDVSDVTDELCDRYGEPPKPVIRLLWVAALRATASRVRINRIDERDGTVRFQAETPDLATWSILFEKYKNLCFLASAAAPMVVYRLGRGEEAAEAAYRLLAAYEEARGEEKKEENA